MVEADVVVVGAGVAGLAAAAALRELGCRAIVLEASGRIGGRAWTTRPAALEGEIFDQGAVWLHAAEHNPLVRIAEAVGEPLREAREMRNRRTFVSGRPATAAELADYEQAWARFEAEAARLTQPGMPDLPLSEVARHMPDDPWAATVETWEGPIIAAASADRLSLRDWQTNALVGTNLIPPDGIGDFVQRRLSGDAEIRLNTPVTGVLWDGPAGRVSVETTIGTLPASACIVTVSTGVLASGRLRFSPPLPEPVQASIDALPMGLATKVVLRAVGPDRLDLPPSSAVDRRVERSGEPMMILNFWPFGRSHVVGWIGGDPAWELSRQGEAAAVDHARAELRGLFGARIERLFPEPGGTLVTNWGSDPLFGGVYAYARPGCARSRARLGEKLGGGRLLFAGEACHEGLAGTLGGAYLSGAKAARVAAEAIRAG
jgi:monoamine oxidase